MKALIIALGLGIAIGSLGAPPDAQVVSVSSTSGQFVAYEREPWLLREASLPSQTLMSGSQAFILPHRSAPSATNAASLILEPGLLVVSCERIKAELLKDLGMTDGWGSKIELLIDRKLPPGATPKLGALHGRRREWSYEMALPKMIQPQALIRALVGAMLVEMANRSAGSECADVPLWLLEGMSAHLEANSPPDLLLQPDTESDTEGFTLVGQKAVRWWLRDRAPLTFQQLSAAESLDTDSDKAVFRACSQLFVEELLGLKDGGASMRKMLRELGREHTWQSAFLTAYRTNFTSLLDVEKWWSVATVDFQSADSGQFASTSEVWRRLQETLDVPVEVRLDAARMPSEARITLQEAITKWKTSESDAVVTRAMLRLQLQRYRSTDELRPMIDAYIAALNHYLESEREQGHQNITLKHPTGQLSTFKHDVCKQLDVLDAQRDGMRRTLLLSTNQKARPAANISSSTRHGNISP